MTTPRLVENFEKFLKSAINLSNLELSVTLHLRAEQQNDRPEKKTFVNTLGECTIT